MIRTFDPAEVARLIAPPSSVEFFSALAKNATGKTLKRECRKKYSGEQEDIRKALAAQG